MMWRKYGSSVYFGFIFMIGVRRQISGRQFFFLTICNLVSLIILKGRLRENIPLEIFLTFLLQSDNELLVPKI